ncbi:site-specific integrase [Streptomyces sp. NBC_01373]|uniref:tyrosine-type recombinase/integrase n=1 Tax=Streptomyces sp. NBC_01373 TaxID=2903843 RepID=UPI0022562B6A|nr:site-specific integrase [Streptomyces sp. NBC_01373]MCX4699004.1 site-specific integrase [Streptomyces sp. NBC_01373]
MHEKLTELKTKASQGIPTAEKTWVLGDYLDYWLREVVKPNRRATTYESYEINVRRYLKPALGHLPLTRLTVPVVQRFLNEQLATGHSVRKVQMIRETLSPALSRAIHEELLTRNVAMLVELPGRQANDVKPWSPREVQIFLEAARNHKWYPAFLLVAHYGLRRGEVIGLRWSDIDFSGRLIHIRQQVFRANGAVQQGPVKTRAGQRDLPLLAGIADELAEYRLRRTKAADDDLVFTSSTGNPIEPYNFTRAFQLLCARHGIRKIKLHHVRHTAATILKDLGVPARDAQLILGHSNIAITQQIYQHDTMDTRRDALSRMEQALKANHPNDEDRSGSCQISCQTANQSFLPTQFESRKEKAPRLISAFSWLGWRDSNPRMLEPELSTTILPRTQAARIKEVEGFLRARRGQWMLGIVAVSVAVKDTDVGEVDLAA